MGVNGVQDEKSIRIEQSKYISDIGEKFLKDRKTKERNLPFNENKLKTLKIAETETEKEAARGLPYLEVIGSLLYACITHPECSYVVSLLCKMMKAPTVEAYDCALTVLEYMVQHKDEGICYTREI